MEAKIEDIKASSPLHLENPRLQDLVRAHDLQRPVANDSLSENVPASAENLRRVDAAVKALEIYSDHHPQTRFQYRTDADTGRIQVTLLNTQTGEIVEEIPSKKVLEFSARLEEMVGLVMEKHA